MDSAEKASSDQFTATSSTTSSSSSSSHPSGLHSSSIHSWKRLGGSIPASCVACWSFFRRYRLLIGTVVGLAILYLVQKYALDLSEPSFLLKSQVARPTQSGASSPVSLQLMQAQDSALESVGTTREIPRVFDVILFNDELAQLEIRLHELDPVVNVFVIIESSTTFSGLPKPLHYQANQAMFAHFEHKVVHVVLPPIPIKELEASTPHMGRSWVLEKHARDTGLVMGLEMVQPKEGDWIMLSDVDEIPRSGVIQAMRDQNLNNVFGALFAERHRSRTSGGDLFRLGCKFYYYSYEFHYTEGDWVGPLVVRYRTPDSPALHLPEHRGLGLRKDVRDQLALMRALAVDNWRHAGSLMREARHHHSARLVTDAGWHCTWCFSNITTVLNKIQAYSHLEHNRDTFKTREWILEHVRKGLDLFGRTDQTYQHVMGNVDIPRYILENSQKFSYMLDRWERPNAGFVDVDPQHPLDNH